MTGDSPADQESSSRPFRVVFVAGVTLGKWSRTWERRVPGVTLHATPVGDLDQLSAVRDGDADMGFVRLPVDREGISVIPLYQEIPVVVTPVDHVIAAFDEVSVADLADEHLLQDPDLVPEWRDIALEVRDGTRIDVPAMTTRQAIETVAAGTGIVIVPKSVARLYNRKDVAARPVTGVAGSQVGLAWLTEATDSRIETFIGIVRGRTERSSRGDPVAAPARSQTGKRGRTRRRDG